MLRFWKNLLVCAVLGGILGWAPIFLHGPIPEKFNPHYIHGETAVWAFFFARMLTGTWVGLSGWPERWWPRGPLCGFLAMLPVTFIPLSIPSCGFT